MSPVPVVANAVEDALVRLAPPGTAVATALTDAASLTALHPEERRLVRLAGTHRRADFAAGRFCAHRVAAALDADVPAIGKTERGAPRWPGGLAGSISHAGGRAAAIAVRIDGNIASIGLDIEVIEAFDTTLWPYVLTTTEQVTCASPTAASSLPVTIFCVKEAVYKAVDPLLGVDLDHLDANTTLADGRGHVDLPTVGRRIDVRYAIVDDLVVAVAVVGGRPPDPT